MPERDRPVLVVDAADVVEMAPANNLITGARALDWHVCVGHDKAADAALVLLCRRPTPRIRRLYGRAMLVGVGASVAEHEVDVLLPARCSRSLLQALLRQAARIWKDSGELLDVQNALDTSRERIRRCGFPRESSSYSRRLSPRSGGGSPTRSDS